MIGAPGEPGSMPTCNTCNAKVVRTDAFCGACGEPVPGAKPVVPIRASSPANLTAEREHVSGAFSPPAPTGNAAQAAVIVAISDPEPPDSEIREPNETAVRERERSEPAPVVPLQRRKDESTSIEQPAAPEEPLPLVGTMGREAEAPAAETPAAETPAAETPAPERGDTSLPNIPVRPAAPPILASDLLREQMRPSSPGETELRIGTLALCAIAGGVAVWAGGTHPLTLVSLALFLCMAILAATPMSYRVRAIGLVLLGSAATGVSLWQQQLSGIAPEGAILAIATILLSGGLLFRAYYRGAMWSRAAVAVGVAALVAWFIVSGGHQSLVALEAAWHSWAPAITQMALGLLALLSLMAFMDSSTRGGTHVWAAALLFFYAVHIGLLIGTQRWPLTPGETMIEGSTIAALLAGAVGTIVAGVALAQVFVVLYQKKTSRRRST